MWSVAGRDGYIVALNPSGAVRWGVVAAIAGLVKRSGNADRIFSMHGLAYWIEGWDEH